jgi:hypothetical protein
MENILLSRTAIDTVKVLFLMKMKNLIVRILFWMFFKKAFLLSDLFLASLMYLNCK